MLQLSKTTMVHVTSRGHQLPQPRKQDLRIQTSSRSFAIKSICSVPPCCPLLSLVLLERTESVWQRRMAQPRLKGDCLASITSSRSSTGRHVTRWWAEKKTGTMSTRRNKKRGFKTRTRNINREWVLKSFTPGHGGVWLRVESRGGNEGSIYHYRLIPSSPAQPDTHLPLT